MSSKIKTQPVPVVMLKTRGLAGPLFTVNGKIKVKPGNSNRKSVPK
jgi:hypothetical protein